MSQFVSNASTLTGDANGPISSNTVTKIQGVDINPAGSPGDVLTLQAGDLVMLPGGGGGGTQFWKQAVRAATTANITLSGAQTIDFTSLVVGDRVLVKDQSTASQNGVYVVAVGAWTRASDSATSTDVAEGAAVYVRTGIININRAYVQQTVVPTIGVSNLVYATVQPRFEGDIVPSGVSFQNRVAALQGIPLNANSPADGQVLTYSSGPNEYAPVTIPTLAANYGILDFNGVAPNTYATLEDLMAAGIAFQAPTGGNAAPFHMYFTSMQTFTAPSLPLATVFNFNGPVVLHGQRPALPTISGPGTGFVFNGYVLSSPDITLDNITVSSSSSNGFPALSTPGTVATGSFALRMDNSTLLGVLGTCPGFLLQQTASICTVTVTNSTIGVAAFGAADLSQLFVNLYDGSYVDPDPTLVPYAGNIVLRWRGSTFRDGEDGGASNWGAATFALSARTGSPKYDHRVILLNQAFNESTTLAVGTGLHIGSFFVTAGFDFNDVRALMQSSTPNSTAKIHFFTDPTWTGTPLGVLTSVGTSLSDAVWSGYTGPFPTATWVDMILGMDTTAGTATVKAIYIAGLPSGAVNYPV